MGKTVITRLALFAIITIGACKSEPKVHDQNTRASTDTLVTKDAAVSSIHMCIDKRPFEFNPEEFKSISNRNYGKADTATDKAGNQIIYLDQNPFGEAEKAIGPRDDTYYWKSGYTIKVQFLYGDSIVRKLVEEVAHKWEAYANIHFNFGNFADPDITISFDENTGSWSYIGTQSKLYRPSMNYGWLTPETSIEEYNRVVLHEFGHALGLLHEHQSSISNPIHWNKDMAYWYYYKTNGWKPEEVDKQVFARYAYSTIRGTTFDRNSIMLYSIPVELTTDGYSTPINKQLSDSDKEFISKRYPN